MAKSFIYRLRHWETWHYLAKYIPIMPVWGWYILRSRSMWFFTPSNPGITFGGFEGEGKKEIYDQLPPGSFPRSFYVLPAAPFEEVEGAVKDQGFAYPFAVKPDVGMMGLMFRRINNREEFLQYHSIMPAAYIVQELITYPIEVSVFYYRFPDSNKGTITGFLKKELLEVTGDGQSTLMQLMQHYPRVQFRLEEMKAKHVDKLNDVLPEGEIYVLSHALNLSRGGRMVSLEKEKDDELTAVFDQLSHHSKTFFYGRYDIKCQSIDCLKKGKNFSILEYNGCGAEPHHIYGNGNSLVQAYGIVLHHWKILFQISRYNHRQGIPYWKFKRGYQFLKEAKAHFKVLKKVDLELPIT